jgi:hypothetical protein
VVVIDINMGFWSMVKFMVKFAFATIPAAIIVTVLVTGVVSALSTYQTLKGISQGPPAIESQRSTPPQR